jgi:hypothetical protein
MDALLFWLRVELLLPCVTLEHQCRRYRNRFDWKTALAISAQTVKGAAEMLMEEQVHPEQLIE